MVRQDIEFKGENEVTLRGWFFPARDDGTPAPVVVMTNGMSSVKEMYIDRFAEFFAENGISALVYDHRNFGDSDGFPRQEVDPILQYRDYQNAMTYACSRDDVDAARVGVWGTSFSAGHALMVAAVDDRVKAVAVQVPFVSGLPTQSRLVRADMIPMLNAAVQHDRARRYAGEEPETIPAVIEDPAGLAVMPANEAYRWFNAAHEEMAPNWVNAITVRSLELCFHYDPSSFIKYIAPTPLLMIVAAKDSVAPYALALDAYEDAREPKEIIVTGGGHFDAYTGAGFDQYAGAARDHFVKHLLG